MGNMLSQSADNSQQSIKQEQALYLKDMQYLYNRSYQELEKVFKSDFPQSESFKKMVILMN